MVTNSAWLMHLGEQQESIEGLVYVQGYDRTGRPFEEVAILEKAEDYKATAVFFRATDSGRLPVPEAFIYLSDGPLDDPEFAETHRRLWSWGGVPLVYRKTRGVIQLFRCAHKADFVKGNRIVCKPVKSLNLLADISSAEASEPWWDAARLRNGTLWEDPTARETLLYNDYSAHRNLVSAIKHIRDGLNAEEVLPKHLRRRLLVLTVLIAHLEARDILEPEYFRRFAPTAQSFFEVLVRGDALVMLLDDLREKFNGNVFTLSAGDREVLKATKELGKFARLVEARGNGRQMTLWRMYSFRDLPAELVSHIYQLFVGDTDTAVYTPPFVVRLMLEEALDWKRLTRMSTSNEAVLDPSCGSGVFLVEAYKRLILYWRATNGWSTPTPDVLRSLLLRVWGVDLEEGAIELAAFSLCLAMCDSLDAEVIKQSSKLFPDLVGNTLHCRCFFEARREGKLTHPIGAVLGNPPFESKLKTSGAVEASRAYEERFGSLPDKQVAYLFLEEGAQVLQSGGVLCLLQQYNFLYNENSLKVRRAFFSSWNVREILDFISIRGMFRGGVADTKALVVVAFAEAPPLTGSILHATFRRTGRVDAEQGFDIDHYDMHWIPRGLAFAHDEVWRANLLGGGRVLDFVLRLKSFPTLRDYATARGWDNGEGFVAAKTGRRVPAAHITGKRFLPSEAIHHGSVDRDAITTVETELFRSPYTSARFTPPMILFREHMTIPHVLWDEGYLTYADQVVGVCAPRKHEADLKGLSEWLESQRTVLQAFVAASSTKLFTKKAVAASAADILSLPVPNDRDLDLSESEKILADDIVDAYVDLVRLGEDAPAMKPLRLPTDAGMLSEYTGVFLRRVAAVYGGVRVLEPREFPGVICLSFAFGDGEVSWDGVDGVRDRLEGALRERMEATHIFRVARLYEGRFLFLLKPQRKRYWLRSVALRDADETLADLRQQGL